MTKPTTKDKHSDWTRLIDLAKTLGITSNHLRAHYMYKFEDANGWKKHVVVKKVDGNRMPVMLFSPQLTEALTTHVRNIQANPKLSVLILSKLKELPYTTNDLTHLLNKNWSNVHICLTRLLGEGLVEKGNFNLYSLTEKGTQYVNLKQI